MQPGPSTAAVNPTYPCGLCEKNVRSNKATLCCDICDTWNHRKCLDMPLSVYRRLGKGDEEWYCNGCCLPPFSNSFFDTNESASFENEVNTPESGQGPETERPLDYKCLKSKKA